MYEEFNDVYDYDRSFFVAAMERLVTRRYWSTEDTKREFFDSMEWLSMPHVDIHRAIGFLDAEQTFHFLRNKTKTTVSTMNLCGYSNLFSHISFLKKLVDKESVTVNELVRNFAREQLLPQFVVKQN